MKKQILALSMVAGLVAGSMGVANAEATLTVNGRVLSTTCDLTISDRATVNLEALTSNFNSPALGGLALGNLASNTNNSNPSHLEISDCNPGDFTGVTPEIIISGGTISGQKKLFSDQLSNPIAIAVSPTPIAAANVTDAQYIVDGGVFWQGTASTAPTDTVLPIYVGMAQAAASTPAAGDTVRAVIDFVYNEAS